MLNVAIIGATGYTGLELTRLLARHPEVNLKVLTSTQYAGQRVRLVFCDNLRYKALDLEDIKESCDFVFLCLPHGESLELVPELIDAGKKVVDLSADYRFDDPDLYQKHYGKTHSRPMAAVYGLPEFYRQKISRSKLVANPGCYPTSILLALAPLLKNKIIDPERIIVDSKSGVSGAGRKCKTELLFTEINGNFSAYGLFSHRHQPEIEQELSKLAQNPISLRFTPHLVPMVRGILSSHYLFSTCPESEILKSYQDFYHDEPFVFVSDAGELPTIKDVIGSNACRIGFVKNPHNKQLTVISVIDNLIRGASGTAVANMNLMCGFPETTGIDQPNLYP